MLSFLPLRLSFLPGHQEDMFLLSFEKIALERCCSGQLCMSAVQRLCRASGFWLFLEHFLRMEENRQEDLTCDEEPWCLSGSDSSDGRSELDDESEVSDFSLITATIDQRFLVVRPAGFW